MEQRSDTVILARVSSKSQEDEGYSLDSQIKLLQNYCEKHGLNVVRVFKIAETASKEQSRKVFHEMLHYISKAKVYHLAVEKTDRFTRNFRDAVAIDDWLEKDENRRLHAVKENLLLHKNAKSDVKFMWGIHVTVAKKYSDNLREEAMKGWTEKLAQGWLPAVPPPGYITITQNGKRIHIPDPETKDLMRQVFKLYLEPGQTISTVAKQMRVMGIATRKGRPYYVSKVHKILTNPFYIGINRFDSQDYPGAQEPIISKKLFNDVQYKIHKGRPRIYDKHNSPLKGLIRCEDCGSVVTWQRQKDKYYGVCRRLTSACKQGKMLRQDHIEEMVQDKLAKLVCPSPQVIDWVVETVKSQHREDIESRERRIASIQAQHDRINRMDDGLYEDKLAGDITPGKYKEKHEQFLKQKAELAEQLGDAGKTCGKNLDQRLVILELSQKAAQIYEKKSPEQKRLMISMVFGKLTLKDGNLSVSYTNFAKVIARKVLETRKVMEEAK
jgi:site-specific DNA recombinase